MTVHDHGAREAAERLDTIIDCLVVTAPPTAEAVAEVLWLLMPEICDRPMPAVTSCLRRLSANKEP